MIGGGQFILIIVMAAVASAGLLLLVQPLLRRYTLARPNVRSSHREPTPQGGGVAVVVSTIVIAGCALIGWVEPRLDLALLGVFAAALIVAAVGAVDDVNGIPVLPRLMLQSLAIVVMIAALPDSIRALPMLPMSAERALLFLGSLWFVNLTNFMDGIDWIIVAEVVPITAALAAFGLLGIISVQGTIVALALGGAILGFAPFNKPVARLFLGDVGSLPIGLLLSWLLILLASSGNLAAAVLLPLYYVADATITLGRRIIRGQPFWQAHREHFYQQAFDRGLSAETIVMRIFAVNVALALLAAATIVAPGMTAIALALGAAIVGGLLLSFARGSQS